MTSKYKEDYDDLKERYEAFTKAFAEFKVRKNLAEKELVKVTKKIQELTKGKKVEDVMEKLSKEIESRLSGVRDAVLALDEKIKASKLGELTEFVDEELDEFIRSQDEGDDL